MSDIASCLSCSLEALLMAKTYLLESLQLRPPDVRRKKRREAVRELKHAETHLILKFPNVAEKVRQYRKRIEGTVFMEDGIESEKVDELEKLIDEVNELGLVKIGGLETKEKQDKSGNIPSFSLFDRKKDTKDLNSTIFKDNNRRNKRMGMLSMEIVSVLAGQFIGKISSALSPKVDEAYGVADKPAYQKYSTWINTGLGLAATIGGVFAPPGLDLPLAVFGTNLLASGTVDATASAISAWKGGSATPTAKYKLVSAPRTAVIPPASSVGQPVVPLSGGVKDYTGGV